MPARYVKLSEEEWQARLAWFREALRPCTLCPRACLVDRREQLGECGAPEEPRIASANIHWGEEPPITGSRGSGTIFLAHCNLHCVFCQNYPISQLGNGAPITIEALSEKFLELAARGAHNLNFVSPTHDTAQLIEALYLASRNCCRQTEWV